MRNRPRPWVARSLLAIAAVAVLAACGSGPGSNAKSSGVTAAPNSTVKATKGGDFCKQVAATYNEAVAFSKNNSTAPDVLHQELDKSLKDGQDTIDNAPAEVKADLQVIQNAVKTFADALAKVGYDPNQLGADALAAVSGFSAPDFQQAAARSQSYVQEHCGFSLGDTSTTTP